MRSPGAASPPGSKYPNRRNPRSSRSLADAVEALETLTLCAFPIALTSERGRAGDYVSAMNTVFVRWGGASTSKTATDFRLENVFAGEGGFVRDRRSRPRAKQSRGRGAGRRRTTSPARLDHGTSCGAPSRSTWA